MRIRTEKTFRSSLPFGQVVEIQVKTRLLKIADDGTGIYQYWLIRRDEFGRREIIVKGRGSYMLAGFIYRMFENESCKLVQMSRLMIS